MTLIVDVGNTRTMMGLYRGGEIVRRWRLETRVGRTTDQTWAEWRRLVGEDLSGSTSVLVASVVPDVTEAIRGLHDRYLEEPPWFLEPPWEAIPIEVGTRSPGAVGADRVAGAAALHARFGGGIVVDFGTATTLDFVDASGVYRGGVILPGLRASARGLASVTAKLPRISPRFPGEFGCADTREGLLSGLYYGTAGAVERIVRELVDHFEPARDPSVVATGGGAEPFVELCSPITAHAPDLVLEGLVRCYPGDEVSIS